jgi:hypothetical protein
MFIGVLHRHGLQIRVLPPTGVLKKSKSINRKDRKEIRKDRKELYYNVLTLRLLRYLCVLCG